MPKYELMYIVGGEITDKDIPNVVDELKKFIENSGGPVEKQEELGKKKFAYPIHKQKQGHYVVLNLSVTANKIRSIEQKIRTTPAVLRYLIVNMDEALLRMEKDRAAQAKLKRSKPGREEIKERAAAKPTKPKIDIDLDKEIEKALEPEELK